MIQKISLSDTYNCSIKVLAFVKSDHVVNFLNRGRILPKRINVRVEHVKHSNCRLDFLKRVKENEKLKKAAKEKNEKVSCKRKVSISFKTWFL